jgi:thiosulfate dehydrogenase
MFRSLMFRSSGGAMHLAVLVLVLAWLLAGCTRHPSAVERGAALASDPALSRSMYNAFACTTCHPVRAGEGDRLLPGAALAGATVRPSYWGGTIVDLFEAVSTCYQQFMRGGRLDRASDDATALYAYLDSLSAEPGARTEAVPFTPVRLTTPPAAGDAARGQATHARACSSCHGQPGSGLGRIGESSILPDAIERTHSRAAGYTEETIRHVIVQKVRSGGYLGFGGVMPPFSREVLTDEEVADIVSFLDPQSD